MKLDDWTRQPRIQRGGHPIVGRAGLLDNIDLSI
jgi:hypothetical protein